MRGSRSPGSGERARLQAGLGELAQQLSRIDSLVKRVRNSLERISTTPEVADASGHVRIRHAGGQSAFGSPPGRSAEAGAPPPMPPAVAPPAAAPDVERFTRIRIVATDLALAGYSRAAIAQRLSSKLAPDEVAEVLHEVLTDER